MVNETTSSKFEYEDTESSTIQLPDGRTLGYAQYGSADGNPVICIHGLPGSRIDFSRSDDAAKATGVRIISVDRPGIGLSSLHPNGTLLSFAEDVNVLTERLELDFYGVLGGSAGGPYSLACAYALPSDKLKALTLVCGLGNPTLGPSGMSYLKWLAYSYAGYVPYFAWKWFWGRIPEAQTHLTTEEHFELLKDIANNSKPHEREGDTFKSDTSVDIWLKTSREAFKNGVDGPVQDTVRLTSDWGFKIEDIRKDLSVRLWYGIYDGIAPVGHGEQYALRIGRNAEMRIRDETHGSMFSNRPEEYLKELAELVKGASQSTDD